MAEGVAIVLVCLRSWIVPVVIIKTGELLLSAIQVQMRHLKLWSEIQKLPHSNRCSSLAGAVWCVRDPWAVCLQACRPDLGSLSSEVQLTAWIMLEEEMLLEWSFFLKTFHSPVSQVMY